jgi:hypothetical protein
MSDVDGYGETEEEKYNNNMVSEQSYLLYEKGREGSLSTERKREKVQSA